MTVIGLLLSTVGIAGVTLTAGIIGVTGVVVLVFRVLVCFSRGAMVAAAGITIGVGSCSGICAGASVHAGRGVGLTGGIVGVACVVVFVIRVLIGLSRGAVITVAGVVSRVCTGSCVRVYSS